MVFYEYGTRLLFSKMDWNTKHSDIVLIVGENRYHCHKIILETFGFFRDLFELYDSIPNVTLNVDEQSLVEILRWIYGRLLSGSKEITFEVAYKDLLSTLVYLQAGKGYIDDICRLWFRSRDFWTDIESGIGEWAYPHVASWMLFGSLNIPDLSKIPGILPYILHEISITPLNYPHDPYGPICGRIGTKYFDNTIIVAVIVVLKYNEYDLLGEIWPLISPTIQEQIRRIDKISELIPKFRTKIWKKPQPSREWQYWIKEDPERGQRAFDLYCSLHRPNRKYTNMIQFSEFRHKRGNEQFDICYSMSKRCLQRLRGRYHRRIGECPMF